VKGISPQRRNAKVNAETCAWLGLWASGSGRNRGKSVTATGQSGKGVVGDCRDERGGVLSLHTIHWKWRQATGQRSKDKGDTMTDRCNHGHVGEMDQTGIPPDREWESHINKGGLHRYAVQMYAGFIFDRERRRVSTGVIRNASESVRGKEIASEVEDGGCLYGNTPSHNLCMDSTSS
jgi:hypothetical protein